MTTQPDIDAIAREAADTCTRRIFNNIELLTDHFSAAIRRALEPVEERFTEAKSERDAAVNGMLDLKRTNQMLAEQLHKHAEAIAERDSLANVAKAADELESLLRKNTGRTDDWPIEIKVSGDCAQELAGKLTALTRALKPYRKALAEALKDEP